MKNLLTLLLLLSILNLRADYWTQKANFPGIAREAPFSFSIGNSGFVGGGRDAFSVFHNDLWEYYPTTDSWTQKANFGGTPRYAAIGFAIGNKGYVGVGFDFYGLR